MMNKKVVKVALAATLVLVVAGAFLAFFVVPAHAGEGSTSREEAMRLREKVFTAFGFFKPEVEKLLRATEKPGEPTIVVAGTSFVAIAYAEGALAWRKNSAAFGNKPFIRAEKWRIPWNGDVLEVFRSEEGLFIWSIKWGDPDERDIACSPFGNEHIRSTVARAT